MAPNVQFFYALVVVYQTLIVIPILPIVCVTSMDLLIVVFAFPTNKQENLVEDPTLPNTKENVLLLSLAFPVPQCLIVSLELVNKFCLFSLVFVAGERRLARSRKKRSVHFYR